MNPRPQSPGIGESRVLLSDGAALRVRPIRSGDAPGWLDLLARCSGESIYARFQSFFHWNSREAATRFCSLEPGREVALVAEGGEGSPAPLLGVGRLILDPAGSEGEYALLVRDDWQNRGVGGVLTARCLEVASSRNLCRLVARTTAGNVRMVALLRRHGFVITRPAGGGWVEGHWSARNEKS